MDLKQALKEEWYGQAFNASLLYLGAAANSCITQKKYSGQYYESFLYVFSGLYGDMYYNMADLKRLAMEIKSNLKQDPDWLVTQRSLYIDKQYNKKKAEEHYEQVRELDLTKLEICELFDLAHKGVNYIAFSVGVSHIIEPAVMDFERELLEILQKRKLDLKKQNLVFEYLTRAIGDSFFGKFRKRLFDVAKAKESFEKKRLAQKIIDDFYWIRNSYIGRHVMTVDEVLKESMEIKVSEVQNTDHKMIQDIVLTQREEELGKMLGFLAMWQDERKENILRAIDNLDRIIEVISIRLNIEHKLLLFLCPDELKEEKLRDNNFLKVLEERTKQSVAIYELSGLRVYSGEKANQFIENFYSNKDSTLNSIAGVTASVGNAVGRVRVCISRESIQKFKEGEILVASMTRPEYLTAMRKAAAIVTDEGGITCHAAIVARELGIPCVIGTKYATKILKDDQIVEVNANHGRVDIIK